MKKTHFTVALFLILFILAACNAAGGGAETAVTENETVQSEEMADKDDEAMMADEDDGAMMADEDDEAMAEHDETMAADDEAMMDDKDDEAMMDDKDDEAMMDEDMESENMADLPLWQTISLTDVRSGEVFTIADFSGKNVFVEPMATWCTNCRRQLGNVSEARASLNDENTVFIALSVETNLSNEALANYTEETGFDWVFAVATPELVQELAAVFGQSVTNPPSTPHFIVRPDGSFTELVTGIESPEEIISSLQANG